MPIRGTSAGPADSSSAAPPSSAGAAAATSSEVWVVGVAEAGAPVRVDRGISHPTITPTAAPAPAATARVHIGTTTTRNMPGWPPEVVGTGSLRPGSAVPGRVLQPDDQ